MIKKVEKNPHVNEPQPQPKRVRRKKIMKKLSMMAANPGNILSRDKTCEEETLDDECIEEDNISNEKLEQVEIPIKQEVKSFLTNKSPPVQFIELSAKSTTLNRRSAISRHVIQKQEDKSNEQQETNT